MWNNVVNAWWSLVFYPATDAPRFTKGMWAMIGVSIATLIITWLVWHLERREKKIKSKSEISLDNEDLPVDEKKSHDDHN